MTIKDPALILSRQFAEQMSAVPPEVRAAYNECDDEVQQGIQSMIAIVASPDADEQEKLAALHTISEALFPQHGEGALGRDLEDDEQLDHQDAHTKDDVAELDRQEAAFADRVRELMHKQGLTQQQLAEAAGVGQSAISMMLARNCRPQRRTVDRLATALKVPAEVLWPHLPS